MRYLPLFLLVLLLGLFWWGLGHDPHHIPSQLEGKNAPAFTQQALFSDKKLDQRIFKDHVTVLNVWATWCLACHSEHAFLKDIAKQKNLQVIGVNYKDERQIAKQWLQQQGNPYQYVLFDPDGKLATQFGVYGTPETFLIDAKGIVRLRYAGALTRAIWKKQFVPVIKKLKRAS